MTHTSTEQPEALRLARKFEEVGFMGDHRFAKDHWCRQAAAELRRQHARIAELEAQLSAIGAGGVEPLRKQAVPQEVHPESIREGAPYDNPEFEQLARDMGVWGTAQSAVCAQFWLAATHPTQQGLDARDAAFEAVRKAFCNLQRYSFCLDSRGNVRRCADRSGNWVEFEAAHTLFEPQSVDAALAAQAKQGEAQQ